MFFQRASSAVLRTAVTARVTPFLPVSDCETNGCTKSCRNGYQYYCADSVHIITPNSE